MWHLSSWQAATILMRHNIDGLSDKQKTKLLKHLNDRFYHWWETYWKRAQHLANLSEGLVGDMHALIVDSEHEDLDASSAKAEHILHEICSVTISLSDELS